MQRWVLEREVAAAAGAFHSPRDASALGGWQSRDAKALQWKCRERNDLFCDSGRVLGLKVHRYHSCVASAWNSGSARNEEAKHENVAEECLNGDSTKASASTKEGSISGRVVFHQEMKFNA